MEKMIQILVIAITLSTYAQWSSDPTVNNPISTAAGNQERPTIVSDGAGGAIITWHDNRSSTNKDIYSQRINASGTVQWTANGVPISTAPGDQWSPAIVSDGAGGAIIAWYDFRSNFADIYAQRINANGTVQWAANGVPIVTATGDQVYPTIVSDDAGGAIITWLDFRYSSSTPDIYAQLINASGMVQWAANGVLISTTVHYQSSLTSVSDGAGGAIITWEDPLSGTIWDIYAQRINAGGTVQWTANGVPIVTAAGEQSDPTIVSDGAGGAIITWSDSRSSHPYIYAQRITASGTVQWNGNGVPIVTATGDQVYPTIVSDGAGGAIIVWEDRRNTSNNDIYAQRVNASGTVQWTADGVPVSTAGGYQVLPIIVSDGAAGATIAWYDYRSGTVPDIYAQRINASGTAQWTADGVPISTAAGDQEFPTSISDGAGGTIITWRDRRSSTNFDIYAQHIRNDGSLGGTTSVEDEVAPSTFQLEQNYPNPFNPSTRIRFSIAPGNGRGAESGNRRMAESATMTLKVFDVLGREVATLVNDNLSAGNYEVNFDATGLSSGVYFYKLQTGGFIETKKMILLR